MGEFQQGFAAALTRAEYPEPDGLSAPEGGSTAKRFSIYRNNVTVSLVNALAEVFPTVQALVGEDYFRAMARVFVEDHPPRSPMLFEYGAEFPEFIETFEPARKLTYLPDVARMERLWLGAFHAADCPPLDGQKLGEIAPEELGNIRFEVHPATQLIASPFAIVTIVSRSRAQETLAGFNPEQGEIGLITRPEFDPVLRYVPPQAYPFLKALLEGATLGEAAAVAAEQFDDFDLSGALGLAFAAGMFASIRMPDGELA